MRLSRLPVAFTTLLIAAPVFAQERVVLPRADRVLTGRPTPVYSVGKAEGQSHELFSMVAAVEFDADDNLYVLDVQNHRVVIFDRSGKFVRQFGRHGQGPGEFQFPMDMAVLADSTIVIADMQRFLRFRRDGTFIDDMRFPAGIGLSPVMDIRAHPRTGIVWQRSTPLDLGAMERRAEAGQRISMSVAKEIVIEPLSPGTNPVRLLYVPPPTETMPIDAGEVGVRMSMPVTVHFAPTLHFGVLPEGGIAVNDSARYAIRILSPGGAVTRIITRAIDPRPVAREDREQVTESMKKGLEGRAGQATQQLPAEARAMLENMMKQMIENARFAEFRQVIGALTTDRTGRIWIQRSGENGPIDIVTPAGQYIGTIAKIGMPNAFSRSGRAAWIEIGEDDVPKISVAQLPAAWR